MAGVGCGLPHADLGSLTTRHCSIQGLFAAVAACLLPCPALCPQYCGVGTDLPLIGEHGWLSSYAFPTEASFRDPQHAQHVYSKCVARLLRLGTTTANYFTTIHVEGCKVLADVVQQAGQRAVLGKVGFCDHLWKVGVLATCGAASRAAGSAGKGGVL